MVVYLSLSSCESCLFFNVSHLNLYIRNTEYPCKNKKNVGNYQINAGIFKYSVFRVQPFGIKIQNADRKYLTFI